MRFAPLTLLLVFGGCATVQTSGRDPDVLRLVHRTEPELRALVQALADPVAIPDYAAASGAVRAAEAALLAETLRSVAGGLPVYAERAALGVTLRICAEGVERLASLPRGSAQRQARAGFAVTCLTPLGLFAGH